MLNNEIIEVSNLPKTWIIDIDGTICKHNGYIVDGHDTLLDGVKSFFMDMSKNDVVIFVTSRKKKYASITEQFLKDNMIRYDHIIYDVPFGERILINDKKPSGLLTSIGLNTERDSFCKYKFVINDNL